MKKQMVIAVSVILTLTTLISLTNAAFASTELIDYAGMSTDEIDRFISICAEQGFTEITLRLRAMYDWDNGGPSSSEVSKAKQIITAANAAGIEVSLDMHTWYTTWDNYFRDIASNSASNRVRYLNYVEAAINAFDGYNVKAWMVLNEPQARRASTSENNFILDVIRTAKAATNRHVSVRFMGGYSPTTGHYSIEIDEASDFICRNVYWDPQDPSDSVYGVTEAKMDAVIAYAQSVGKELWITEFGERKNNIESQRAYVEGFVDYAIEEEIDSIFAWVSQPEGGAGENYNIFNGYTPNPAFYELAEFASSRNSGSDQSSSGEETTISSSSSQSPSEEQTTRSGLEVGVWHLDEGTGSTVGDSSYYNNDGIIYSASWTSGQFGNALSFDGYNDYMRVPHDSSLTGFDDAFTVYAWIRMDDTRSRQSIVQKYDTSGNQRGWFVEFNSDNIQLFASQDGRSFEYWGTSFTPVAGTWYHIAVVWRPNQIPLFYIDGQLRSTWGSGTISSIYNNSGTPLDIGRSTYDSNRYFDGKIDEVYLYSRELSAQEISDAATSSGSDQSSSGEESSSQSPSEEQTTSSDYTYSRPRYSTSSRYSRRTYRYSWH